jgi:Tfp pilus assembly protein PilF
VLKDKGQLDEAIACHKTAIALDPKFAGAHNGLGVALYGKGQLDEAIACYKKAIELAPKDAEAHTFLGNALRDRGQVDEAIAWHRKAIALDPKFAGAHSNLGVALLYGKGQVDEAIACYKKAIALDPKLALAHLNLGAVLCDVKGDYDGAILCFRKAIALDPKYAKAQTNLGVALKHKGQLDEAIACYKTAIALDPKLPNAHVWLGETLFGKGRYAEARDASARALALLLVNDPLRARVSRQLQECGRLLKLEARLPAILRGEDKPASARESLDVAQMCVHKKMNAAAARFWATAFAADAKLADDLQAGHRYNAACYAALAAAGQGEDAAKLDDKERARLRKQALDWLRADLAAYAKLLETGPPPARALVQRQMRHWQKDSDLAGIRDAAALAKLPAAERTAFTQLWSDAAALLKKAEEKGK